MFLRVGIFLKPEFNSTAFSKLVVVAFGFEERAPIVATFPPK